MMIVNKKTAFFLYFAFILILLAILGVFVARYESPERRKATVFLELRDIEQEIWDNYVAGKANAEDVSLPETPSIRRSTPEGRRLILDHAYINSSAASWMHPSPPADVILVYCEDPYDPDGVDPEFLGFSADGNLVRLTGRPIGNYVRVRLEND